MKCVEWIGTSRKDLQQLPDQVQRAAGYALHFAQIGQKHGDAKPLKGLSGVMEIVADHDRNTYRAVYAAKIGDSIYVLHVFQKKSTRGIKTPKHEMELIRQRLREAQAQAQAQAQAKGER